MDENTLLFRSAFNGFKREDVMEYITKTAKQNEAALAGLREELAQRQAALDAAEEARRQAEEQIAAQQTRIEALQSERNSIAARCADTAALLTQKQKMLDDTQSRLTTSETARKAAESHGKALSSALTETRANLTALQGRNEKTQAALATAQERIVSLTSDLETCREDAKGYIALAQQVGRTMLHAEVANEKLLSQVQAQADEIKRAAEEESAAALADAKAQSAALLDEAKAKSDAMLTDARERSEAMVSEAQRQLAEAQTRADELKWTTEEENSAALEDAKKQSTAIVANARMQSELMLTEAQNQVAQARSDVETLSARREELFSRSHNEYVVAQDTISSFTQRMLDELDSIRNQLLDLSGHVNEAKPAFEQPVLDESGK